MKKEEICRSAILLILLATISEIGSISLAENYRIDPMVLIHQGSGLYDLGLYNESILVYEQAIKIGTNNSDAWIGLGNALFAAGNYNESIEAYDRASKLGKRNASAWYGKGNALFRLGRNKEAINCYDYVLVLQPGYSEAYENRKLAKAAINQTTPIEVTPLARISLTTNPPGAKIFMDGKYIGNSTFHDYFSKTEKHEFVVEKNGQTSKVTIDTAKDADLEVDLYKNNTTIKYGEI